jgi:competence protein ComEA
MNVLRRMLAIVALAAVAAAGQARAGGVKATQGSPATKAALLDLNSASREELLALPGIGEAYAARIVKGRPYTAKNQLVSRGILPARAYETIKDRVIARQK